MYKQKPRLFTLEYSEANIGAFTTVRHFELIKGDNEGTPFSNLLNLAENRQFAKSSPDYWLKAKNNGKWDKKCITGLFNTPISEYYFGDHNRKKDQIICLISQEKLVVHFIKNYYSHDTERLIRRIKTIESNKGSKHISE
jgi:hypothetical protein